MKRIFLSSFTLLLFLAGSAFAAESAPETTTGKKESQKEAQNDSKIIKKATAIAKKNTGASAEYHFSMAQAYASDGESDRAIEEYKLTLMFDPTSSLVLTRLATEYVKKGMFSAAMESSKEALKFDPRNKEARLVLAGLYSTSHEAQKALAEYDQILKDDPKNEEAAIFRAQVLMDDNRVQQAINSLTAFTKKNPESALGWYYLGRAEQLRDHFKDSVAAYRKALEVRENFSQAALALGFLYEEKHLNPQAIETYKALFDDTQDPVAASRLVTIYLKEEKYKDAVPFLQAMESADPEDMNTKVKLGLVQMEMKNFDEATRIFKKILEKNPDADRIHYYLGSLYEETKKPDLAIAELKQIPPDSRMFPDAILHASYLLRQASNEGAAKDLIKHAIEKSPRNVGFYLFQASLEEENKDLTAATAILEKAVKEFPDDEKVHYYLGSLYDRQGNSDKGIGHMEAILKVNPQNVDALNYIGYTWTLKGIRLDDAEKLLRRALGLRPDNGYIQDSWGWHLFVRGRLREAVVELEKAAKLKPNEPTILEHLGDAYLRANLREKALTQYNDAAKFAETEVAKAKIQTKADQIRQDLAKGKSSERLPASDQ